MKAKGLLKKAAALTLGITMATGVLTALPDKTVRESFISASAYEINMNDILYYYHLSDETGVTAAVIDDAVLPEGEDTLKMPSIITHEGDIFEVTEINRGFLQKNKQIKTVIFPYSVKRIGKETLMDSSVESIVMPNELEFLGSSFAENCRSLTKVECSGTKLTANTMGSNILYGCSNLKNEKGVVTLGNWLIKYNPPSLDIKELKIADLGNGDVKIDSIYKNAIWDLEYLTDVDLEGIKRIDTGNFVRSYSIETVRNYDSLIYMDSNFFANTPWFEEASKTDIFKMGSVLLKYPQTDSNVLDFTQGDLAGVTCVISDCFKDCKNIDTIKCPSDIIIEPSCFFMLSKEWKGMEVLVLEPIYNIKTVYIDGKKLTNDLLKEDPAAAKWLLYNANAFKGAVFMNDLVEDKTKRIFDQMNITYYGYVNDKAGTLSAAEEFEIRHKIHNYISAYDYNYEAEYSGASDAFLLGGSLGCENYANLTQFLLECAGVNSVVNKTNTHCYNSTQIGGEWFDNDDGWNAQMGLHNYYWFGLSTSLIGGRDPISHTCTKTYSHIIGGETTDQKIAQRTIGDVNSDDDRTKEDVSLMWSFIKGEEVDINKKAADINFDGKTDVTDAVLLDQFVNAQAVDPDNVAKLGYAPTVKVAFLNGTDYEGIRYLFTDSEGYITLPDDVFEAPEGKKPIYDVGRPGEKVRITTPLKVVHTRFVDKNAPDTELGDVNGDGTIDIEDAVSIIQHINGMTPLTDEQEWLADVSKDGGIDIDDAVLLISYINGNSTF